ncbi:MAG: FMN-binding protein [Rhodospirillaceae bacterium]
MRASLMLIPAAIIGAAAAPAAQATVFMNIEQAQQLIFPGIKLKEHFVTLDQDQYNALVDEVAGEPYGRKVRAWRTPDGEWFVIDQVPGKDEWITYAVGIDTKGTVKQIEIIETEENYDAITHPAWRSYFRGRQRKFDIKRIPIISGSTLSSQNMAVGVRRVLATVAIALEPSVQGQAKP